MQPGSILVGRYRLGRQIGSGGAAIVVHAVDERLGRHCAVKLLGKAATKEDASRRRLEREARAAAILDHPNIVKIFDVGTTEEGELFIVMELVRGTSLRSFVRACPVSPRKSVELIAQVARGLGAAHRHGFVHRDVKPENIMVSSDGRAVVLDFGLAKAFDTERASLTSSTITAPGKVVGTPEYLSPEQARGREIDARTDQFSLAVVAYELVTGRRPWTERHRNMLLLEIASAVPPRPSSLEPALPRELDAVLLRALAKEPHERYEHIDYFADALEEIAPRLPLTERAGIASFGPISATPISTEGSLEETNILSHSVRPVPVPGAASVSSDPPSMRTPTTDENEATSQRIREIPLGPDASRAAVRAASGRGAKGEGAAPRTPRPEPVVNGGGKVPKRPGAEFIRTLKSADGKQRPSRKRRPKRWVNHPAVLFFAAVVVGFLAYFLVRISGF